MNSRLVVVLVAPLFAVPAGGYIGNPPSPEPAYYRMGVAELVVVGKVEEDPAEYKWPAASPSHYNRAARVAVSEVLLGPKDTKAVRVVVNGLWVKLPKAWEPVRTKTGPNIEPFEKGREGLFYLRGFPDATVMIPAGNLVFVDRNDPSYTGQLRLARRLAKLLADPKAALRSKEPADRLDTAGALLWRYRSGWADWKADPDAEESRLILRALADAEWVASRGPGDLEGASAGLAFEWLKPIKGFDPPPEVVNDFKAYTAAAKRWLRDNEDRHRVTRYLPNKK